jgi:hypothetical protein
MSRWPPVSLCLALFAGGRDASAEAGQKVRLSWVRGPGASSCIDQPALEARIVTRLGRAAFERDAPRSIEAYVARDDRGWHASLQVRDASTGKEASRDLSSEAETCAPLESAVALAIALVIDPDKPVSSDKPIAPPRPETPVPVLDAEATVHPMPPPSSAPPAARSGSFALRGTMAGGLLPGAAAGIETAWSLALGHWIAPSAGVLFLPERRASDVRFGFGLTALGLGACAELVDRAVVRPRVCAQLWAGAIHSVVYELVPMQPGERVWFAASVAPEVHLSVGARLFVVAGGEVVVPIIRDSFRVTGWPDPVFEESPVAFRAFAGIGVDFP